MTRSSWIYLSSNVCTPKLTNGNDRTIPFSHHENRKSPLYKWKESNIGDFEGTQFSTEPMMRGGRVRNNTSPIWSWQTHVISVCRISQRFSQRNTLSKLWSTCFFCLRKITEEKENRKTLPPSPKLRIHLEEFENRRGGVECFVAVLYSDTCHLNMIIVEEHGCVRTMGPICSSREEDNNICGHHEKQREQQMGETQKKARNSMNQWEFWRSKKKVRQVWLIKGLRPWLEGTLVHEWC